MPQTPFCAEVRIVNMGTKQFSLSFHIHNVGMWLFPKHCQMEKGREWVTMNIVLPLLKWAEASIWLGAKSLVNGCDRGECFLYEQHKGARAREIKARLIIE